MKKYVATAVVVFLLFTTQSVLAAESVNINTASAAELDAIVGIGPTLAQRIIDARPFNSLDDLLRVKGIGEKTLQKIKDQELASITGQTTLFNEEPFQQKKELPNDQKSDKTINNSTAAAPEPLKDITVKEPLSPVSLFWITIGSLFILGAGALFWESKIKSILHKLLKKK